MSRILLPIFLFLTLAVPATAAERDPWFGRDKAYHFGASAMIALEGYAICSILKIDGLSPFLCGAGLSAAAGLGKEGYDLMGHGDPSFRDLTWDGLGIAAGLGLAWGIERLASGGHPPGSLEGGARLAPPEASPEEIRALLGCSRALGRVPELFTL